MIISVQFSRSVVSDSVAPWNAARQASLFITNSRSLLKLMSIESVMPSNHLPLSSLLTQMFSLCTQKPTSTSFSVLRSHVQSITQSTWLHFLTYPKSHHLTIATTGTLD